MNGRRYKFKVALHVSFRSLGHMMMSPGIIISLRWCGIHWAHADWLVRVEMFKHGIWHTWSRFYFRMFIRTSGNATWCNNIYHFSALIAISGCVFRILCIATETRNCCILLSKGECLSCESMHQYILSCSKMTPALYRFTLENHWYTLDKRGHKFIKGIHITLWEKQFYCLDQWHLCEIVPTRPGLARPSPTQLNPTQPNPTNQPRANFSLPRYSPRWLNVRK